MFGSGSNAGFDWLFLVGAVALIGLIAGVVWLLRGGPAADEASAILAGRLARGEIAPDEFARLGQVLGPPPHRRVWSRSAAVLAVVSLVTVLALGGLTFAGALPRPGPASIAPGAPGFVAGTVAAPRIVRIIAGPDLRFYPDVVPIAAGETITFEVTTMGLTAHEFMVGPAADVAADREGTPEVADISMMQTRSLTYTFVGPGPFSFACHAPGHYEAGMTGRIEIAP